MSAALLLAILVLAPDPKPRPAKMDRPTVSTIQPAAAADTLVMATTWTNPPNDGKGPLDSLRIRITGWATTPARVWTGPGPYPTAWTFREPIDYSLGTGGTATYTLRACATVWRYGQAAESCSPPVSWTVTYPAPPAPGSVGLTVTKVP